MDTSKDQTEQDKSRTLQTDPAAERRKVIRGMAAVPVMMTLMNGSARAADSNLLCIDKNAAALEADLNDTTSPNYNPPDDNFRRCVPEGDVTPSLPARPGAHDTGGGTAVRFFPDDQVGTIDYANPRQACVRYVDANGNPTTYDSRVGDSPVTGSCYASFTPP